MRNYMGRAESRLGALVLAASLAVACSGSDGKDGSTGPQGETGETGAQGEPGPSGSDSASVSGVFPGAAFTGNSMDVTISGFATEWDETTTVSFGENVTVDNVTVASPTALIVTISIGRTADIGARDVVITTGDSELTYASGFKLATPIDVEVTGTAAQGSLVALTIKNLDPLNPFDTTSTGDGLFTPIEFTNIEIDVPVGYAAQIDNVAASEIAVTLLVDLDAPSGPLPLEVLSGPAGDQQALYHPSALDLAERTPVALTAGTPAAFMVDEPLQSELFSLDTGSDLSIVELNTSSLSGTPELVLLGTTGSFANIGGIGGSLGFASDSADTWYALLIDLSGASGYNANLDVTSLAATAAAESSMNDTFGEADAVTLPAVLQGASLDSDIDSDWFSFDAAAGDVGKVVVVRSYGDDNLTDTVLEVYEPDGSTLLGESGDDNYHESLESAAITQPGTHYVRIYASSYYDAAHTDYDAYMYLR